MLIVFFLAALVSGALTIWLLWSYGVLVALLAAAVVASALVGGLAALVVIVRSRSSKAQALQGRGVLDLFGRRHPR